MRLPTIIVLLAACALFGCEKTKAQAEPTEEPAAAATEEPAAAEKPAEEKKAEQKEDEDGW